MTGTGRTGDERQRRRGLDLALLWGAQLVSQLGDHVHAVSVVFLVLLIVPDGEGAAWKAGLVCFLETVPFLVFGFLAGGLADRVDRLRLMMASDVVRALLLLVVFPILWHSGMLTWWAVGILTFFLGLSSTPFNPCRDALVPVLAGGRSLLRLGAIFQTSQQLAMILATLLAGMFLYVRTSAGEVGAIAELFVFNGATFAVSFALLAMIRPPASARGGSGAGTASSLAEDLRAGLARVRADRLLLGLLVLTAINNFFIMGPAQVGANLYVKNTLGLGAREVAWFVCAMACGWFGGSLVLLRWGSRISPWKLLFGGMVMDGLTHLPFFWIERYDVALAAIAVHGVAIPFLSTVRTAIIQERVESRFLGKVFSLVNLTVVGFTALSVTATGFAGEFVSPPVLFFVSGCGGAISGAIGWLAWRASTR